MYTHTDVRVYHYEMLCIYGIYIIYTVFPPKINSRVGEIYKLLCFKFHTMKICSIKVKFLIYNKNKGGAAPPYHPLGETLIYIIYIYVCIYIYI